MKVISMETQTKSKSRKSKSVKLNRFRSKVLKGKALAALQQALKRQNAAFAKLTLAQQRVQIAQDVITQVKIGKLVPTSTYFDWADSTHGVLTVAERKTRRSDDGSEADVDLSVVTSQVKCQVCGIGSLFVAAVERADKLAYHDFTESNWSHGIRAAQGEYLEQWFDEDDLDDVEAHFECGDGDEDSDSPIMREADPGNRMIMIMENIISNRGRFNSVRGAHKEDGKGKRWY